MLRIESLEIDDFVLDKIESKHGVTFEEVEEACLSERRHVRRSREGLYKLFSQTAAGRYILVVLVNLGRGGSTAKQLEVSKMADIDKEVERIEQGDAWEESDEVVRVEVKRPLDKVIPVRLPSDKWEQIRQEARELGVGPTTLARMWILERLRQRVKA